MTRHDAPTVRPDHVKLADLRRKLPDFIGLLLGREALNMSDIGFYCGGREKIPASRTRHLDSAVSVVHV